MKRAFTVRTYSVTDPAAQRPPVAASAWENFELAWDLTVDAWAFYKPHDAERRLQRHLIGFRRK